MDMIKQMLALKKKAVPEKEHDGSPTFDPKTTEGKGLLGKVKKLQARDPGGNLDLTPKKKDSVMSKLTAGGFTPLGREAKDSLQKNGVGSAIRTVARGLKNETKASFGMDTASTKKPLVLKQKVEASPASTGGDSAAAVAKPAVDKAAKTIEQRTKSKLARMSSAITAGTRAANPNPFKK